MKMNQTSLHKHQPASRRSGRGAGLPGMLAAHRAGSLAAVLAGRAGSRAIFFACPGSKLWPVYPETSPGNRHRE